MSYVVAQLKTAKSPKLYKVKDIGGKYLGVVPDESMWEGDRIDIRYSEVIVSLGDKPPVGSVYGAWIEPVLSRKTVRNYGNVYLYADMTEQTQERVLGALPMALERVRRLGPQIDWDLLTEVRNPRGLILGTYKYKPKDRDVFTLRPQAGQSKRELVKVATHELGHGVWLRHMTAEDRAEWIRLYDKFVSVTEVPVKDVRRMLRDMAQIGAVRDYIKDAEPEEQAACAIYLSWLKKVHGIDARELNDLVVSGSDAPAPDTHLHRSDTQTPITLYSKTSPVELFCEALSSEAVGDLSDRNIQKLLGKLKGERKASRSREQE